MEERSGDSDQDIVAQWNVIITIPLRMTYCLHVTWRQEDMNVGLGSPGKKGHDLAEISAFDF